MALNILYQAENMPIFQNKVFSSAEEAKNSNVGNVTLVQNSITGIVENITFEPELLKYDQSYQNEQGISTQFHKHLEQVRDIIIAEVGKDSLIEVGCGKGYFLNMLKDEGINIKGVDAAYEGDNPDIIKALFCPGIDIKGEGLILRHVLEHIQNPVNFLWSLAEANEGGYIYIEVPCFDWIIQNNVWFDIFYEHVNYFRMEDFYRMFSSIKSSGHLFGGQYMYVVADLKSLNHHEEMKSFRNVKFPENFLDSMRDIIEYLKTKHAKIVVWGGSSKGVIFALNAARLGVSIDYIVDINPAKQNKYIPVSGLMISSPEIIKSDSVVQDIVIMNSNYATEIRDVMGSNYNYIEVEKHGF